MTVRQFFAWIVLGEVRHRWQFVVSAIINGSAGMFIALKGGPAWFAALLGFMSALGLYGAATWAQPRP